MTMREKQILARTRDPLILSRQGLLKSKKKIGGNHAFFRDNLATIFLKSAKIQSNVWHFFPKVKLNFI